MTNPFDQFDDQSANPFDQFDEPNKSKMSIPQAAKVAVRHGGALGLSDEADGIRALNKDILEKADAKSGGIGKLTAKARSFMMGGPQVPFVKDVADGLVGVMHENTSKNDNSLYTTARDARRSEVNKARQDRPVTSFVSEAAPSVLLPAAKVAQGAGYAGKAWAGVKSAAPLGMMYGFGEGEGDLSDRGTSAVKTGALSAVAGAGFGAGAHGVGKLYRSVFPKPVAGGDILETALSSGNPAVHAKATASLEKALTSAGLSSDDIGRSFNRFKSVNHDGNGRLSLASFLKQELGEANPKLGETIDNVIYDLQSAFPDEVGARVDAIKNGQSERFSQRVDDITFKQRLDDRDLQLGKSMREVGEELYEPAIARGPVDEQAGQYLRSLLNDKELLKHVPKDFLTRLQARRNPNDPSQQLSLQQVIDDNPLRVAHAIYSGLRSKSRSAIDEKKLAYDELSAMLREPLFRAGGKTYQKANAGYQKLSESRRAMDFGRDVQRAAGKTRETDQLVREFADLPAGKVQNSALMSIRDIITDASRSAKEGDLVKLTTLQKDGFLDAIHRLLPYSKSVQPGKGVSLSKTGADETSIGQQLADEIRTLIREADDVKTWSRRANVDQKKAGREAYAGSLAKADHNGKVLSVGNVVQDMALSGMTGGPVPLKTGLALAEKTLARVMTPSGKVRKEMIGILLDTPDAPRVKAKPNNNGGGGSGGPHVKPKGPQPSGGAVIAANSQPQSPQQQLALPAPQGHTPNTPALIKPNTVKMEVVGTQPNIPARVNRKVQPAPRVLSKLERAKRKAANRHAKAERLRVKARAKTNIERAKLEAEQQKQSLSAQRKELERAKVADRVFHERDLSEINNARPQRKGALVKAHRKLRKMTNSANPINTYVTGPAMLAGMLGGPAYGLYRIQTGPKRKAFNAIQMASSGAMSEVEALSVFNGQLGTDFQTFEELRQNPKYGVQVSAIMNGEKPRVKDRTQSQ